jgi:hypothetical protein
VILIWRYYTAVFSQYRKHDNFLRSRGVPLGAFLSWGKILPLKERPG